MSDTPETDKCVKDNKHLKFLQEDHYVGNDKTTYENPIVFLSQKLERERDRALADLEFRRDLYKLQSERLEGIERERDEAIRSCHIWQKGHAELVAERDKYWEQITYLLDRLNNAERGFFGSNKRLFTSPFTDPQLPVVNSFSGDAMKIIAHKKHE
jgi:hypothetical protein